MKTFQAHLLALLTLAATLTACPDPVKDPPKDPSFTLNVDQTTNSFVRGGNSSIKITVSNRVGDAPITVGLFNPPTGITSDPLSLSASQSEGSLTIKTDANANLGETSLTIRASNGVSNQDKTSKVNLFATKEFSFSVDETLKPVPDTQNGSPLAATRDESGQTSVFITNQILISTTDQNELNAFVARVGGTVLGNDAVPEGPPGSGIQIKASAKIPSRYRVQVDPSSVNLAGFKADAEKAGLGGKAVISSDVGAKLLALVTKERAGGLKTSPNFIMFADAPLFSSEEHPTTTGFNDAISFPEFSDAGSRSSVKLAWQWIAAKGVPRRAKVAIIDGGFWLDPTGKPFSSVAAPGWASDFPAMPLQYDFNGDDYVADGVGIASCSGGSVCNWHGNGAAGVAVGQMNNRYGLAGTGGQVADPMLFKTSLDWDQTSRAIRTAVEWGADVISMSFGAECDNVFCDGYFEFNLYPALRNARDNKVVMVAAAGNTGLSTNSVPCKGNGEGVICIGALADDTNTAIGYSNFGPNVDLWAPTNIRTLPDGETMPNLKEFGGTSASTPFVAGIAAMIKTYAPSLTSSEVRDLLRRTAWTDSSDPKVSHAVNAYRALQEIIPTLEPDALEANNTALVSRVLDLGSGIVNVPNLNLHVLTDRDHYRFTISEYVELRMTLEYQPALGHLSYALVKESGAGSLTGLREFAPTARGQIIQYDLVPPGTYRLVVSADHPNEYRLNLYLTSRPLSIDRFEINNLLSSATVLPAPGFGEYALNLHTASDDDFFYFNPSRTSTLSDFVFGIPIRDMALTLRLFNSANTEIGSFNCAVTGDCALSIPNGVHRVKVESALPGQYTLRATYYLDRSVLFPDLILFPGITIQPIDPGDPAIPHWLIGENDVFGFKNVGKSSKGILIGLNQDLKFRLLDKTGKVLSEGKPNNNPQLPAIEIPLTGLTLNENYLLEVLRPQSNPIDGEVGTLSVIPYSLDLGN